MPFRLAASRRTFVPPWLGLLAAAAVVPLGCGNREDDEPDEVAAPEVSESPPTIRETPSSQELLGWLAQDHRFARSRLGPHRLQVQTRFSVDPPPGETDATVVDEIRLTWASAANESPRFELVQRNDHGRGRAVVLTDDHIHVRVFPRPWARRLVESNLHELWLDDAQHTVHDLVELAAHRMEVTPATDADDKFGGRPIATYVLSLAEGSSLPSEAQTKNRAAWRAQAEIELVEGRLVMDVETGLWLDAEIRVGYRASHDSANVRGSISLRGTVTPGPTDPVRPPPESSIVPELPRYQHEQRALLDGIAAI